MMRKISILGCGWLGFPLAKHLLDIGYEVNGSTTSENKIAPLESSGIAPFLIRLKSDGIEGKIEKFLDNIEILIIDIPPHLRGVENESFIAKIAILIPFIERARITNVLFISSISVYGNESSIVTEHSVAIPETESGKQILAAEKMLQTNAAFKTTILRFGGLIGPKRHPINSLAGKENLPNPHAPVNLIHLQDCIGIIDAIIETRAWNIVFNAVTPYHPTRLEYYTIKANELGLALPEFKLDSKNGKVVCSDKLTKSLNYHFKVPNL